MNYCENTINVHSGFWKVIQKDRVGAKDMLLREIRDIALWSCGFTASLEGTLVTIKKWNNLGLSSCTVP